MLEQLTGQQVKGFGVPFDHYDGIAVDCVRELGFVYGRGSEETRSYAPVWDPYRQQAGMFHLSEGLTDFVDGFLRTVEELAACIIVGHSYDLDAEHLWETTEEICKAVSEAEDVLSMTHLELVEYQQAMLRAEIRGDAVVNRSHSPLWFAINGEIVRVDPIVG